MKNQVFGANLQRLYPVVEPNLSDSGSVDCVLEFLIQAGGRSLPEVVHDSCITYTKTFCETTQNRLLKIFSENMSQQDRNRTRKISMQNAYVR